MKKTKTIFKANLVILSFILALVLGACQTPQTNPTTVAPTSESTAQPQPSATQTAPQEGPVTVYNAAGEPVILQEVPQAIVASSVWIGEMILDMVPKERIKALSSWGDDPVLSETADLAGAISARINTLDVEGILAVEPDLVLIDTFSDADGSLSKTLGEAGVTVLQMQSPTTFLQIRQAIETLALAVGEVERGAELIDQMDEILDGVAAKLSDLPQEERLSVLYYEDHYDASSAGMLAAYGKDTPFEAIATAAGLINVCDAPAYTAISKEKVVGEWRPDILVVPSSTYGADFKAVEDGGETVIGAIREDEIMQTLPAVVEGRLVALTERYRGSTSQYMARAVEELARFAYPDYFED